MSGQPGVPLAAIRDEPLRLDEVIDAVRDPAHGAVVTFSGVVRNTDDGRAVTRLEFVAHPTAADVLGDVAARLIREGAADRIAVLHRVGTLKIGEVAVVIAAAAGHRRQAFEGCAAMIDRLKTTVPIWKRQVFADATDEWVGTP